MSRMNKIYKHISAIVLVLAAAGCSKPVTTSTGEWSQQYLDLWMAQYHPGIQQQPSGIYILEDQPGTGALWSAELPYTYAGSTIRALSGSVTSTTDETLAKQLGTYVAGNYYGSHFQATGYGLSYAGVDAILEGMRMGGVRTAVVPGWLLSNDRKDSRQAYMDACTSSSSLIYTIRLEGQSSDLEQTERDSLKNYIRHQFKDTVPAATYGSKEQDGSFYFLSQSHPADAEEREETASLRLNYTGKLLNGQVFDTTNEKTAKDAGIWTSGHSYSPVSISYAADWSSIQLSGSSNLIDGFKGALSLMKYPGEKAVVLFTSSHGYKQSGSGSRIPAYSPLLFELELLPKE